ncbi:MAG: glycosyl transferase family 2 [Planctomycetota bacterium]|nr:glycosyl transferase family 2 [Planctomycetota bacterium]
MIEISVVIPAFNRAHLIGEAIESVLSQETDSSFEIVVSDDGSTDGTADVARSYGDRVRVLPSRENHGGAAARNIGIRAAHGELIALLDSDDTMLPGRLRVQADYLRRHPAVGLVSSAVVHERGEPPEHYFRLRGLEIPRGEWRRLERPLPHVIRGFIANSSATTARRSILIQAGLYDETLFNPDLELLVRMARLTQFACCNLPLGWIRAPRDGEPVPPSERGLARARQAWCKILRDTPELEPEDRLAIQAKISGSYLNYFAYLYFRREGRALREAISDCEGERGLDPTILRKWRLISRIPLGLGQALLAWKPTASGAATT